MVNPPPRPSGSTSANRASSPSPAPSPRAVPYARTDSRRTTIQPIRRSTSPAPSVTTLPRSSSPTAPAVVPLARADPPRAPPHAPLAALGPRIVPPTRAPRQAAPRVSSTLAADPDSSDEDEEPFPSLPPLLAPLVFPPGSPFAGFVDAGFGPDGMDGNGNDNGIEEDGSFGMDVDDWYLDGVAPPSPAAAPADPSDEYSRLLFARGLGLACRRVDERRWVLEDFLNGEIIPGIFHHITADSAIDHSCDCPESARPSAPVCRHRQVVEHSFELFAALEPMSRIDNPPAVEISSGEQGWLSSISVRKSKAARSTDAKRTVVRWHSGDFFACVSCKGGVQRSSTCCHRTRARDYLVGVLGLDVEGEVDPEAIDELVDMDELPALRADPALQRAVLDRKAVSQLAVAPPAFSRLPSDTLPHHHTPPHLLPPVFFLLDSPGSARCPCGAVGGFERETDVRPCRVYTRTGVEMRFIQVQRCTCRSAGNQFTIGPDLGKYGLYNWNNEIIVEHALFNDYSSAFLLSPTPLAAFRRNLAHRYLESSSPYAMLPKSTFNPLFYSFVRRQFTEVAFACPECGADPEHVICDGVHSAFAQRHRLATLAPPTVPHFGTSCSDVKPPRDTTFLSTAALRKVVLSALSKCRQGVERAASKASGTGRARAAARRDDDSASGESSDEEGDDFTWKSLQVAIEALGSNTGVVQRASRRSAGSQPTDEAKAFKDVLERMSRATTISSQQTLLTLDLLSQLSAHESIIQFCRPMLVPHLVNVTEEHPSNAPTRVAAVQALRQHCPAIGNLIQYHRQHSSPLPFDIQILLLRIAAKVNSTIAQLRGEHETGPTFADSPPADWRSTGTCYGATRIRNRPFYSRFKETGSTGEAGVRWGSTATRADRAAEKEGDPACQKFYSSYTEAKQTGGIMALWCRHSVCVGFHVIPRAEGRNDVFSAIFTRWRVAPKTVIYDFACALGPYCLSREPAFFANTLFAIDQLHQHDHTKCSRACFLETYMGNDLALSQLNSSAAECGNSGLSRIRKMISYCKQENAVLLIRHFLNLWNRRIVNGESKMAF